MRRALGCAGLPSSLWLLTSPPPFLRRTQGQLCDRQGSVQDGNVGSGPNIIKIQDGDSGALSKHGALLSTGAVGLAWLHTGKLAGQVLLLRPLYQRGDCQGRGVLQGRLP